MTANPLRTALALLFFALSGVPAMAEISCRSENGVPVDWVVFYKVPKVFQKNSTDNGLEYLYLDSITKNWKTSSHLINNNRSILGRTLEPLYEAYNSKSNNTAYLIYNDGVPKSKTYSRKYGHTKGLLVWNKIQGIWLIHSVPGFPPFPKDGYDYPSSGRRYGQNGICVTFKYSQYKEIGGHSPLASGQFQRWWSCQSSPATTSLVRLVEVIWQGAELYGDEMYNELVILQAECLALGVLYLHTAHIGKKAWLGYVRMNFSSASASFIIPDSQLFVSQPNIYSCSIPNIFHQELIHMTQMCDKSGSLNIPVRRLAALQSAQGLKFLHFAKSSLYTDDIFSAWMAQSLKTHLLAETWHRRNHEFPSNCSLHYHVYNINRIRLGRKYSFSSYHDHSKWGVSKLSNSHWTCIGDLNRDPHQVFRGGGFICTRNWHIYQSFHGAATHYKKCG